MDINQRLGVPLKGYLPDLTGMDDHVEFISSWLKDGSTHTADILTILGMDGIGKTYLARHIYRLHCLLFQKSSFIEDINRKCSKKSNKILDFQKKLFSDISKPSLVQVNDVSDYTSRIEKALEGKKVLLVLDDVDSLDQLSALHGKRGFHPGSKIIITTKDASLTKKLTLHNSIAQPKHTLLVLKGLNKTSSLQLLSVHAFKCRRLEEGYEEVFEKLLKYCQGHPQALKVLGECLCDCSVAEWEEYIELELYKEMNSRIVNVFRRCFDSLGFHDKELFKHIASFFAGKDRVFAETILQKCDIGYKPGLSIQTRIKNLINRCLLMIGPRNELMMHQLLQDIGRHEIRQESPYNPWKRSRLWCHEDSFKALQQKRDKINLLGIVFDRRVFEEKTSCGSGELETDLLSTMDNLMFLLLNYVKLKGSYKNFPKELRWLCMHGFPSPSIPSDLPMENLVALDISYSNIQCFDMSNERRLIGSHSEDKRLLPSLKILNLSFCYQLRSLRGFLELPALERLILVSCRSLTDICGTIGFCDGIVIIDLSYCTMLRRLPSTVLALKKLTALSLDGCNLVDFPVQMRVKEMLGSFKAKMIQFGSQVSSSIVEALPRDVRSYAISSASLLLREDEMCNESFPMAFSTLSMSETLILDGNPILFLPNCVTSLRRIELLSLRESDMLKTIKHTSLAIRNLKFSRWELLQKIKSCTETSSLRVALTIYLFAHSLIEMEGIVKIQPMAHVEKVVICRLGWRNLDLMMNQVVETWGDLIRKKRSKVQLFYEFGIFSTVYGGKGIPEWINDHRSPRSSISFTLSSSNNLRGLNFCYLQKGRDGHGGANLLTIIVSNITKKRTWIYKPYIHWVKVDEECPIWLSHWMFGKNEMENGNEISITIPDDDASVNVTISECGVSLVYDDSRVDKEDPLGYYKSWDGIIGRDLSAFQLTSGEYFLDNHRFYLWHIDCPVNRPFIANGACYEENGVYFRKES